MDEMCCVPRCVGGVRCIRVVGGKEKAKKKRKEYFNVHAWKNTIIKGHNSVALLNLLWRRPGI